MSTSKISTNYLFPRSSSFSQEKGIKSKPKRWNFIEEPSLDYGIDQNEVNQELLALIGKSIPFSKDRV
jgi:hypothetical protein